MFEKSKLSAHFSYKHENFCTSDMFVAGEKKVNKNWKRDLANGNNNESQTLLDVGPNYLHIYMGPPNNSVSCFHSNILALSNLMTFHISEFELSVPYQAFAATCSTSRHFDILIHQITPKRSTFLPDMSTAVAANAVFFRFPLELRRNIYFQYLIAMYRPSPWMLYKHTRKDWSPFDPSLFRVNLQIQREMVDVTRQQRRFCYRISSQEATLMDLLFCAFGSSTGPSGTKKFSILPWRYIRHIQIAP